MHASIDPSVGPKLGPMIRRSRSERSARRAALILESGLGADVESLAHRNETELDEIRALTVDFNVRGMRAISRKPPKAVGTQMSREDIAVVEQMISLTPRAFGRPDWRWLPEEVIIMDP